MEKTGVDRDSQAKRPNSLKHLTEDELLDVFETARRRSTRDHALMIVCFQHALRASELISLKLGDIDWRNMEITIQLPHPCWQGRTAVNSTRAFQRSLLRIRK